MPYLRPKTRRRLPILMVIALLAIVGGWLGYRTGQRRTAATLAGLRSGAMADYAAGNRQSALGELGDYLARGKQQNTDADALLAYAMCRESIALPGHRNLIEAIGILEHYRLLRPADMTSAHTLLEWYRRMHDHAEALSLANSILSAAPNDSAARSARIEALWGLRRLPEALAESERLNRDAPALLAGQLMTTYLLVAMDRGKDAVGGAVALCDAYRNDARFEMLRGVACMLTGDHAGARTWLSAAAAGDASDADFALEQCRFLDAEGLFDDARALLARTARHSPTPGLVNQLLLRVYQDQGSAALLDTLSTLPAAARATGQARGLRSAALSESGNNSAELTNGADQITRAWSIALAARFAKHSDSVTAAAAYRDALQLDPGNAIIADWLADAEAEMGERELALALWRSTAAACPNWATPCIEMATTLETLGRPEAALGAAQSAAARAPRSFDTQLVLAGAMVATMPRDGLATANSPALSMAKQLMARWPDRPEVAPLYAAALARTGQKRSASQVIERALQSDLSPAVLMSLADVDKEAKLCLDDQIEEKLEQFVSHSPAIALAAARLCSASDASLIFDDTTAAARKYDPAAWEMAIDQRDDLGDADSLARWRKLGDAFPKDVRVQFALSQNPCRFRDRAFWQRSIDRLRALVGEQGLIWRTEQARWLLSGPATPPDKGKQIAQAVTLLRAVCRIAPDCADSRHLLGVALYKAGNVSGAIDELSAAADLAPADPAIVGDLSHLLAATGRTDEAIAVVRRLAHCPILAPAARQWAERTLAGREKKNSVTDPLNAALKSALAAGDVHAVELDCRQILARDPKTPDACNDLAYALLLEARPQDRPEALRLAQRAVSISPERAEYRDTLQRLETTSANTTKIAVSQ